jgi:hypothetical protein
MAVESPTDRVIERVASLHCLRSLTLKGRLVVTAHAADQLSALTNLHVLDLSENICCLGGKWMSINTLRLMLPGLTQINALSLRDAWGLSSDTLLLVGTNCRHLRYLKLDSVCDFGVLARVDDSFVVFPVLETLAAKGAFVEDKNS